MNGDIRPIRVGDSLRDETDEEEEPVPLPQGRSLCETCYHRFVCAVALSIRTTGSQIAVGACEHHLPVAP